MTAAQATGWHAMSDSAADNFRKENYIIAGIIVYLENLIFRNFQDEDLPPAVLHAIESRLMLDAKTVQGQERYFDNYEARAKSSSKSPLLRGHLRSERWRGLLNKAAPPYLHVAILAADWPGIRCD